MIAIIRPFFVAVVTAFVILAPVAAPAAGPCQNTAALQQINAQKHALQQQRRQIQIQYRGPGNASARSAALASIDRQMDQLENQKRALNAQRRDCREDRKHRKHDRD